MDSLERDKRLFALSLIGLKGAARKEARDRFITRYDDAPEQYQITLPQTPIVRPVQDDSPSNPLWQ